MLTKRISMVLCLVFFAHLGISSASSAGNINRVFGWVDQVGGTLSDTNVVYGPGGNPCRTEQFATTCNPKNVNLEIISALGICTEFPGACISEVWIQDNAGVYQKGRYVGERVKASKPYSWTDNTIPGLARSHASNLFDFPGVSHNEGRYFEIIPMLESAIQPGATAQPLNLSLSVNPVFLDSKSKGGSLGCMVFLEELGDLSNTPCWRIGNDLENRKIRITLNLPTLPSGWVTGRISNVSLSTSESTEARTGSLITISGRATRVANILRSFVSDNTTDRSTWSELAKALNTDAWNKPYSFGMYRSPDSIDEYVRLVTQFPWMDKATSEAKKWVANFSWEPNQQVSSQCKGNSLIGYAGSNAMTFSSQIPKYNSNEGTIEYKIASPHLFSDNSVDLGQYELLINQSIAKCLWNVSQLPNVASLQVLNSEGASKVASSTIQTVGNYLRFNASGFSFSQATIKAKLEQTQSGTPIEISEKEIFAEVSESPATLPSATPSPSASKASSAPSRSLKCYKGAKILIIKKAPYRCPKGYMSQKK